MISSRVSVVMIAYRARKDVEACLNAILKQTHAPVSIRVIDNASDDGTPEAVRGYPEIELIENDRNIGYAAAANQGIRLAQSDDADAVLLITPDVVLDSNHIATLVDALAEFPKAACACGRLLRPDGITVDTAGIIGSDGRDFRDRGQGRSNSNFFDRLDTRVFAACGAAVLHRMEALDDVAVDNEYFDESLFAYKEDIDMGWRYRLRGWQIVYAGAATATHNRRAAYPIGLVKNRRSLLEMRHDRAAIPRLVRRLSTRNQLLLLAKNEHPLTFLSLTGCKIIGRQLARLAYVIAMEPTTLPAYFGFLRHLPGALRRRFRMKRVVNRQEIASWFSV